MNLLRFCLIALCAVLCFVSVSAADVIHLKDGGKIEGKVITETETEVQIATKYGVQNIPKENIKQVETTPTVREVYREKLSEIEEGDADAHYQLGLWCKEQGLVSEAELEFREAIKLNPGHHGARVEMGFVFYGGRWVHVDELKELMESRDFVAYNGRLVSRSEYEKLTAEEEDLEEPPEDEPGEEETAEPEPEETQAEDPGVPWVDAYELKTSHYAILTNLGKKVSRRYTKLMEELHGEYRKVFKGYRSKDKSKYSVWVYRNQQDFMQETGRRQDVGGYYDSQAKRVVSYRGVYGSGTTDAVFAREGCHQYLDSIMASMNSTPVWIVEGFAVYFESVRVSESGSVKMGKLPRDRLIQLKAAISQGNFIPVSQLIRRARNRFGPVEEAHAWSLIYFMMKSGGKYGKMLGDYFDKCATYVPTAGGAAAGGGRGRARTNLAGEFEQLIGDVQAFEDGWKRFISGLSVPPAGEVKGDTFTSDSMGFEITKPSGWTFISEGSGAGFQAGASKGNSKFEVFVYANSKSQDSKAYASQLRTNLLRKYAKVDLKESEVSGHQAAELLYSDENQRGGQSGGPGGGAVCKYRSVVIAASEKIYVITFQAFASMYDQDVPDFEKALGSLKLGGG